MFKHLNEGPTDRVTFTFDGTEISSQSGISLAEALLAAGIVEFRRAVPAGDPRGPYCLMGVCFECLLTIDGLPNHQACLTDVRPGMQVCSQKGLQT